MFPCGSARQVNEVFSNMVRQAGAQALMFIETVEPLADVMETAGMTPEEAWKRAAQYPKALFDAIQMVRVTVPKGMTGGAMLWGSFQTTKLVIEFSKAPLHGPPQDSLDAGHHVDAKEGQLVKQLEMDVKRQTRTIGGLEKRLKAVENKK